MPGQFTTISMGTWWTELAKDTQNSFIAYAEAACANGLVEPQKKAEFIVNVCLRVLRPEEGDGNINETTIADLARAAGYYEGQVLIFTKHLFDRFKQPVSTKEAAKLLAGFADIREIQTLCRQGRLLANKNQMKHWRIDPESIIDYLLFKKREAQIQAKKAS